MTNGNFAPQVEFADELNQESTLPYLMNVSKAFSIRVDEATRNNQIIAEEELRAWQTVLGVMNAAVLEETGISTLEDVLGSINHQLEIYDFYAKLHAIIEDPPVE